MALYSYSGMALEDGTEDNFFHEGELVAHVVSFPRRKDGLKSEFILFHKLWLIIWPDGPKKD